MTPASMCACHASTPREFKLLPCFESFSQNLPANIITNDPTVRRVAAAVRTNVLTCRGIFASVVSLSVNLPHTIHTCAILLSRVHGSDYRQNLVQFALSASGIGSVRPEEVP